MTDDDADFEVEFASRLLALLELAATKRPPAEVASAATAAVLSFATKRAPVEQVAAELASVAARLRASAAAAGARH